jgi:hypothetical protein
VYVHGHTHKYSVNILHRGVCSVAGNQCMIQLLGEVDPPPRKDTACVYGVP